MRAEPRKYVWHRASLRQCGSPKGKSGKQGTAPASGNDAPGSAGREDGAGTGVTAGHGCQRRAKHGQSSGARAFGIIGVERRLVLELTPAQSPSRATAGPSRCCRLGPALGVQRYIRS